jgi:hypothetical protein
MRIDNAERFDELSAHAAHVANSRELGTHGFRDA